MNGDEDHEMVTDLDTSGSVWGGIDPSTSYLLARLESTERRVRALIAHRRQRDPDPEDLFRGLYLSEEHVDRVLASGPIARTVEQDDQKHIGPLEAAADALEASGTPVRLRALTRRAGLDRLDVDLLLVALAPDLDNRFERLYGYLNDDVTARRATVGLSLELCGASTWSGAARSRMEPGAPLLSGGLLTVEETQRPFLSRPLRVPDRVAAHLLEDDRPDKMLAELLWSPPPARSSEVTASLASAISGGVRLVYLREHLGGSAPAVAIAAFGEAGVGACSVDLNQIGPGFDISEVARILGREALLTGNGVVAGPVDEVLDHASASVRALATLPGPVVLYGRASWEPLWSRVVPLVVETPAGSSSDRFQCWESNLAAHGAPHLADSDVARQFILSGEQVARAVESARLQAQFAGQGVTVQYLRSGARAQNGAGLERLARRIPSAVGWDDLVLAPATLEALRELAGRARQRDQVLDLWGMRPGGGRGRGITALFSGDSGTGKTMSAEVVAHHLGFDLYTVSLATVIDKYVGETEKNLERIFAEADGVNAVLLFDEADALFGKRSEVRDAHDRYANIEVAYLLQRMETFDGVAILATNLRTNVDDAFTRRLDTVVEFPAPDAALRRCLWDRCLAPGVPRGSDLDLDFCAQAFELSGGNIRSITVTAAYLAAERGNPVGMGDLIRAVQREYRKLGRLVVESEFGEYFDLIAK